VYRAGAPILNRSSTEGPTEIRRVDVQLEALLAVDQHDRDPNPVDPLQALVAVDQDLLELERHLAADRQDRFSGLIA
jgi:hypothetical protein